MYDPLSYLSWHVFIAIGWEALASQTSVKTGRASCTKHVGFLTLCCPRANADDEPEDDILTIRCPDDEASQVKIFKISRQTLARSPIFNKFFESAYYLPDTEMLMSFINEPAGVFDIVQRYLEQGPELFDTAILSVYVHTRYTTLKRTIVLVRLCKMAQNMGLWCLHDMALEALLEGSRFITATMLPTIAGLIFARKANYDHQLKEWCLLHAGQNFSTLKHSVEWAKCLDVCENELRTEWERTVKQNEEILKTLEDDAGDGVLEGMIHGMSPLDQRKAISAIVNSQSERNPLQEVLTEVPKRKSVDSDMEEWEDITAIDSPALGEEDGTVKDAKARSILGSAGSSPSVQRSPRAETAKARLVMGIDAGFGKGSWEVRKTQGRKSRILSILH